VDAVIEETTALSSVPSILAASVSQAPLPAEMVHPENRKDLAGQDLGHLLSKILIVDDEPINVKVVRKYLRGAGYSNFVTTTDATTAIDLITKEDPDIILLDYMMPGVNGLDLLKWLRSQEQFKLTPVLILTASTEAEIKLAALEAGATDFLPKPLDPHELFPRVRNALIVKAHQDHLASYSTKLEQEVQARTAELEMSRLRVFQCLARAGEFRDDTTGTHVLRVGRCTGIIAAEFGYSAKQVAKLELAAQLHDIGKIGIPDAILLKPGKLTPEEFEVMRKHTVYGKGIIDPTTDNEAELSRRYSGAGTGPVKFSESPLLALAASIALTHHEKFDGSGYPNGLRGEDIPLEGRMTAIVDVFDALQSPRPYKTAMPVEKCLEIIAIDRGKHFDPRVHDALLKRLPEILDVYAQCSVKT
jgi:putative two-component system response regulator